MKVLTWNKITLMVLSLVAGTCVATSFALNGAGPEPQEVTQEEPFERRVWEEDIMTKDGPSKIWICNEPNCPEGCDSKDPAWGIGLILEESRKLQGK